MLKRNKKREKELGVILNRNIGKTAALKYENYKGSEKGLTPKWVIGKIGKLERDFNGRLYGNSVYIERMEEDKKHNDKLLDCIDKILEKSEKFKIIGEEKPENYQETYHIRRVSELVILD